MLARSAGASQDGIFQQVQSEADRSGHAGSWGKSPKLKLAFVVVFPRTSVTASETTFESLLRSNRTMNHRQFDQRRSLKWSKLGAHSMASTSFYGSSPDAAPALAWLQRGRSESDVDTLRPKTPESPISPETGSESGSTTPSSNGGGGQGARSPVPIQKPETQSKGSIEVVSSNVVSYNGTARMAPSYIKTIHQTSSIERFEKCNSCDDLVKVFNGATCAYVRGSDVSNWEQVSNK